MEPEGAAELSERDQLWAAVRALRPHLDRLAAGGFGVNGTAVDVQLVELLARIVAAELDFRDRGGV
jgi:hypothetical protein